MRTVAVIPARYGSTRFEGKPLALLNGRPMVLHVVDRCREAKCFDAVVVATDDARIEKVARGAGVHVQMTSPHCESGTDRVAEVARALIADVFINVQGDEPALHPQALWSLVRAFDQPAVEFATLIRPLKEEERPNPNVVKAVLGEDSFALYFSRADLPFTRVDDPKLRRFAHLGIYGYRAATLLRLASLKPTALERTEGLEQLRALGHGIRLFCVETRHAGQAVDVPDDVAKAEAALINLPKP